MAGALTLAIVGAKDTAQELGRKGTSSDVTLFNHVRDGHALTVVEPTQFPEKFPPLLIALAMADRALFVIPALSREVAETAATLEMFDLPTDVRLGAGVGEEELRRAFKGSPLAEGPMAPWDANAARAAADGWNAPPNPGAPRIPVDHAFPVKGVGAVALGVVRRGTLSAHARLRLFPSPTVVEVRSIQVHDVDVPQANVGERVGVALKGVEAEAISRGMTLAPEGSLTVTASLRGTEWRRSPHYRGNLGPGTQLQALVGLQLVPAKLDAAPEGGVQLTTDRPVAFDRGDRLVLADLSPVRGPRIVGRALLAA